MGKITRNPINIQKVIEDVSLPHSGAVAVFTGTVRNHDRGRKVAYLEYDCYETMADEELIKIEKELSKKYRLNACCIIHRIGQLRVGEISLIVAVSSDHRKEAFAALSEAVEMVKKRVPIWKKEYFTDGTSVWINGEKLEVGND